MGRVTEREFHPGAATLGARLADVALCEGCHEDVADGFRASAHGHASFDNPLYRVAVERLAHERGTAATRVCGGCHDIALLVDGALDAPIEASDRRAHAGISCRSCHGFSAVDVVGNGAWTLDARDIPLPREGDRESLRAHKERTAPPLLRSVTLCVTCHRSFLDGASGNPHALVGQDDATPWARSVYAGSLAERIDEDLPESDCRGCHMPAEATRLGDAASKDGRVRSHRFLGGHTYLAAMRGDDATTRAVAARMRAALGMYVVALTTPSTERGIELDVVVRNVGVGHNFPGGVRDAQDTWLEVSIVGEDGGLILGAGLEHEASSGGGAHVFASHAAGDSGARLLERETHLFRTTVFDATIPPRDAAVIRFAGELPQGVPRARLTALVKLRHRSRTPALRDVACRESKTVRGARFRREGGLDPCVVQPVTTLAEVRVPLVGARPLDFDGEVARGLGLLRGVSEAVHEAAAPLARAYTLARTDRERAIVLSAEARLAIREGRAADALSAAAQADELVRHHPAVARLRGDAHKTEWRLADAAHEYGAVARASPRDDGAFAEWAMALGGAGRFASALDAARVGLVLQPRGADLLRVQAASLDQLGASSKEATGAFLSVRLPEIAPRIRAACSARVAGCAAERMGVHAHRLEAPP